jgi:hypothetical protein
MRVPNPNFTPEWFENGVLPNHLGVKFPESSASSVIARSVATWQSRKMDQ